jgi:hypothetical protein
MPNERVEIGRIARLQIQTDSLKRGSGRDKHYDPAAIAPVDALTITRDGATALVDGVERVDVHNNRHPQSKQRDGINPLSIGFTKHYARMRERFGSRLSDGIAGENMLVEAARGFNLADVAAGFVIQGEDGRSIELTAVSVAHPCVEFSRFALDDPVADSHVVSDVLRFLDAGVRGFYVRWDANDAAVIRTGDRVYRIVE